MTSKNYRLGNIVRSKINGISRIEQIGSSLNPEYIGGRSLDGNYWENSYLPVELTEQWLIDFGFKKEVLSDDSAYYYYLNLNNEKYCHLAILSGDKNGFIEAVTLFPYEDWFRYKYVHELQNLYHAITGTELELKNNN